MKMYRRHSQLLWLTAVLLINVLQSHAANQDTQVKTNTSLKVIPTSRNSSCVTELVFEGSLITTNEANRLALASYPMLEELNLTNNLVTEIPAQYFAVVPKLRVLSLSRNKISRLHPDSFSGLQNLTELDLSHNLLTGVPTELFSQKFRVLQLQGNPWNCSCPLLSSTGEGEETNNTGGTNVSCASLESPAGRDFLLAAAACEPSTPQTINKPESMTTVATSQQPLSSATVAKTSAATKNSTNDDQKPVPGNTWKFTVCVTALALCTSMVIMCAIKGPSWYKLFHDYRHRRLLQEEDEGIVSTVFSDNGRYEVHQTFNFDSENGQIGDEGEEDAYFEDPYIRREDDHEETTSS